MDFAHQNSKDAELLLIGISAATLTPVKTDVISLIVYSNVLSYGFY
jgi:hypothetical protein